MNHPASNPWNRFLALSMTALFLLGCGGGFRNGHAPGDIETLDTATVYHLADGVFIHERHDGNDHYYLIEATAADYRIKPEGLEVEFGGEWQGTLIPKRQPEDYVTAFITLVPGEDPEVTRFGIDPSILRTIIDGFSEASTVEEIYQLKR